MFCLTFFGHVHMCGQDIDGLRPLTTSCTLIHTGVFILGGGGGGGICLNVLAKMYLKYVQEQVKTLIISC